MNVTHAEVTATTTGEPIFIVPAGRYFVLDSAIGYNATGLATHADNWFVVQINKASDIAAKWSTDTGVEGTITAATAFLLVNGTLAKRTFAPGDAVNLVLTEGGTATLPAGNVTIHGRLI
jgi:hypothetical protein